jgi:hypothetical protein
MEARPLLLLPLVPLLLAAARPAPLGTETEAGFGVSQSQFDTLATTPVYRQGTTGLTGHLQARHRLPSGFTFSGQLDAELALVTTDRQMTAASAEDWTPPQYGVGELTTFGGAGLRAGWHGKYIGAEVGGGLYRHNAIDFGLRPSAEIWMGLPQVAYLWAGGGTGPMAASAALSQTFVGVGHHSKYITAWYGAHVRSRLEVPPRRDAPWQAGAAFAISPGVRLGGDFAYGRSAAVQSQADSRALMMVIVDQTKRDEWW